jgi:hypothetical protein
VPFTDDSVEAWMQEGERDLGPILMAKRALEQQGRWDELRADLVAMAERQNTADDGTMHVDAEYLLTVARVPT